MSKPEHGDHLEELDQCTRQLASALKRVELNYDDTLQALGAALDLRDSQTAGHSRRVTRYCLEIARRMRCTSEQLEQIARGSYLHDIGKIGIPDAILRKPGRLTEEETAIMQAHSRIGYDLVCQVAFLAPAAEIVLTHQERYDGTGYPQGLMGEEIPLGARIFAMADTLDAMTSDRPYRRALPFGTARKEITRESGRQFDPEVVRAFLVIPEEVWLKIRAEVADDWPQRPTLLWPSPLFRGGASKEAASFGHTTGRTRNRIALVKPARERLGPGTPPQRAARASRGSLPAPDRRARGWRLRRFP